MNRSLRYKRFKAKARFWGLYWLPSVIVGSALSIGRKRVPPTSAIYGIAVFLIEHIGDAVVAVPLLRRLRQIFPEAKITLIASATCISTLEKCPYVDQFIKVTAKPTWFGQLLHALSMIIRLRTSYFDLAIVPKDALNAAFYELISIGVRSKWKISLRPPGDIWHIKPLKFDFFYDEFVLTSGTEHEAKYRLSSIDRFAPAGINDIRLEAWLSDDDQSFAEAFFNSIEERSASAIAIAFGIGASAAKRRWPLQSYAAVIDGMSAQRPILPIVIIGPGEVAQAQLLASMTSRKIYFSQIATVRQSAALISRCALFIGNDSGPMHLAASLGVPVVEISCHPQAGDTRNFNSPRRYGPLGVKSKILQPLPLDSFCEERGGCQYEDYPHCITTISSNMVLDAATALLAV